jgi:hypothetical protein
MLRPELRAETGNGVLAKDFCDFIAYNYRGGKTTF